ncbi:MAG: hypothetical protein OHK0053_00810 [Microscillaceae bacterium]
MRVLFIISIYLWMAGMYPVQSQSEKLMALYVKGGIQNLSLRKEMVRGMTFRLSDKIKFSGTSDRAVIISNQRGRYVLSPSRLTGNELIGYAADLLNPFKTQSAFSTRGNQAEVEDLPAFLGLDTFYIVGPESAIHLSLDAYPLGAKAGFLYRFDAPDQKIVRTIPFSGQKIFLRAEDLQRDKKGQAFASDFLQTVEVYHYEEGPSSATILTRFQPVFLPEAEIRETYALMARFVRKQKLEEAEKEKYFLGFFRDYYGRTDEARLKTLLIEWGIW